MSSNKESLKSQYVTADQAVKLVKSGDHIFVQGSGSIPELWYLPLLVEAESCAMWYFITHSHWAEGNPLCAIPS